MNFTGLVSIFFNFLLFAGHVNLDKKNVPNPCSFLHFFGAGFTDGQHVAPNQTSLLKRVLYTQAIKLGAFGVPAKF
ncbi:hypothetical protein AgCh_009627 [Apium graveolens]